MRYSRLPQVTPETPLETGCPVCGKEENEPLGVLGRLIHYRCRDCGYEYHEEM